MKAFTTIIKYTVILLLLNLSTTNSIAQQIYINEFLASNSNVNVDDYGENDDWIELYNSSGSSVNIGGMFLTDDLLNTNKWMIPSGTTISGNGYLLIWCDNQDAQGALHTNFKLSSSGESVALVANDATTIIDSYTYGPQTANTSQGRANDGGSSWIFFAEPTPDATNDAGTTIAAMPVSSQDGGHYNNDITITLTTTTPGGTIRYTLDGSNPTSSSSSYSSPLDIDETTVLRARTFKSGMEPSRTMTHTYMYGIDHTMPIFCVSTDDDNFFGDDGIYTLWDDDIEVPCHVELYETDGSFGFRQDLGVQVHGGFSQSYPHKGISFIAKNQYGNNKISYPLFPDLPFDEYGSFILRASGNDWSKLLFRDALAANVVNDISDVDSLIQDPDLEFQGYRPAIVYLNGEYFGIHNLREKLDWRYLKTHYGIEKEEADIVQRRNGLEHGNLDAWTIYRDFIEDGDFTDPADLEEMKTWIDLDHFVDYFLHNVFIDNNDWPDNNNKGWRLRADEGRWRYFLYDMDRGFGLIPLSGDYNSGDWTSESLEMVMAETQTEDHNKEWSTLQLRQLMQNDGFRLKFINRMADLLNIMYTPERLIGRINDFEAIYTPEINAHADKWWNNNDYVEDVEVARIFSTNRNAEMWDQFEDFFDIITGQADLGLNAQPQTGGIIHLNTMNFREENFPWTGKYFEGVDVPLRAQPNPGYFFTGWTPSSLGNNTITTMNLTGDEEITANFILGSTQIANIVINEINYHSPDTAICDAGDWIELYNAGNEAVDLSGWFLEDGSGNYFNIPQNTILGGQGYLVLVEDETRFQLVNPTVTNFVGGFGQGSVTGNMGLSNGGEWISINNANRTFIDSLHYDDKLPWPESPDGDGPTLQLISPTLDNALASSWTASQDIKGTPGAPNQGSLYLGENSFLCTPQTVTLDASYEPCFGCTYQWNTGATTASINVSPNEGTNTYAVTVTDLGGAIQMDEIIIDLSPQFNLSYSQQNLVCYDDTNGSIDLSVNGTGSYTYQWTNGATTQDVNNLAVGAYTVTVSDALFCTQTEVIGITAPTALISSAVETEINCYGELASIDVSISGGAFPFTYNWSNGATSQDLIGLPEGNYAVTVTDMNNCTNTLNFSYSEPTEITGGFDIEHGCDGLSNGNIDVDMEGGAGGYFYEWSNGAASNSDDLENLSAGIYLLTVTDNAGCSWTSSAEVLASTSMFANAFVTNTPCPGDNSGSIDYSINGGNAPYLFEWDNGATTDSIENLSAGPYQVTVTDFTGCQFYDSLYVAAPEPVSAVADVEDATCFGTSDASISVVPGGGNGMYTYAWSNGGTSNSINNLSIGNYNLTLTDGQGCSSTFAYLVEQPTILTATTDATSIDCNGSASGSINTLTQGGTAPYSYLWSNGQTTESINNIIANSYSVTITDANNCSTVETATVTQNTAVTNNISQTNILCNNENTGSISINTTGGESPYTYLWDNDETTAQINNLPAGTYQLTITDNNDCTSTESITLTSPSPILGTTNQTPLSCFGGSDGTIMLTSTGGNAPYEFDWSNNETGDFIDNLTAGEYIATITDNNNCTATINTTINNPNPIEANAEITAIDCSGSANALIDLTPSGGAGGYSFIWNTGATSTDLEDIPEGAYSVTITDANNCSVVESILVSEPSPISLQFINENLSCFGSNNGYTAVEAIGGEAPFEFLWSTGSTAHDSDNLPAGSYFVTVTDMNGCTKIEETIITAPDPLDIQTLNVTDNSCFGTNAGNIAIAVNGGTGSISFEWDNGTQAANNNNLAAGTYVVTITDSNNCTLSETFVINQPTEININPNVQDIDCFGQNSGAIDLTIAGGVGEYSFIWNTGANTQNIDDLLSGEYTVTVSDENNCTMVEVFMVTESELLSVQQTTTSPNCFGESNGQISLSPNGGEAPYDFNWDTGSNSNVLNNLAAGSYSYTITDNNGCTTSQTIELTEPTSLSYSNFQLINNNCFAASNGMIALSAQGGNGNYNYEWNTGDQTNQINGLLAGNYVVTVTDGNNCSFSESFDITEPTALNISSNLGEILCNGDGNGNIAISISGGTGGYTSVWNTGATEFTIENLQQGVYTVTVSDELACTAVESFNLNEPANIAAVPTVIDPSCHGLSTGSISLFVEGGTLPFEYLWDNGFDGPSPTDLTAGDYTLTITDANNCTYTQTVSVSEPDTLEASYVIFDNDCFEGTNGSISSTISGGTMPYTYSWSTGDSSAEIDELAAADYTLTITDANDCLFEETVTVTEASMIEANTMVNDASCFGSSDGNIQMELSGGTPGYEIEWEDGNTLPTLAMVSAGTYAVTVVDMVGCQTVFNHVVSEPTELTTVENIVIPTNANDGSITITPQGGSPDYSIEWEDGSTDFSLNDLASGVYNYIVTDENGCEVEGSVSLINTSIAAISEEELIIYPNPTKGIVNLESDFMELEILVYNVLGTLLQQEVKISANGKFEVDLDGFSSGLYFLRVKADGRERVERVVVER